MSTAQAFLRDANHQPITSLGLTASKAITYVAGTTGATGATTLFTVTGVVALRILAVCSSDLLSGGAATIEVGLSGNTAALIAQSTATAIDTGEIWVDATPATAEALPAQQIVAANIIQTIGTTTITGGVLTYYCLWAPISSDGDVVAA